MHKGAQTEGFTHTDTTVANKQTTPTQSFDFTIMLGGFNIDSSFFDEVSPELKIGERVICRIDEDGIAGYEIMKLEILRGNLAANLLERKDADIAYLDVSEDWHYRRHLLLYATIEECRVMRKLHRVMCSVQDWCAKQMEALESRLAEMIVSKHGDPGLGMRYIVKGGWLIVSPVSEENPSPPREKPKCESASPPSGELVGGNSSAMAKGMISILTEMVRDYEDVHDDREDESDWGRTSC